MNLVEHREVFSRLSNHRFVFFGFYCEFFGFWLFAVETLNRREQILIA